MYIKTINDIVEAIKESGGGLFGIDRAIKRLSNSVSIVPIHNPNPLFL